MKKHILLSIPAILVLVFFVVSCKKKDTTTEISANQPLTDQLDKWGDSLINKVVIDSVKLGAQGAMIYVYNPSNNFEYVRAFGTSDITTARFLPLKTTDLFRIGTITNTFTATVILQLAQDGALSLEDSLGKFFPGVPNAVNITIREMLNMTSGLYDFMDSDSIHRILSEHPLRVLTPVQLVNFGTAYPPYFQPGGGVHYSSTNSVLLGMIIEQVTGSSLSEAYRNHILEPLSLSNTTFPINQFMPFYAPYSHGYEYADSVHTLYDVTERYDPSWSWASANLVSSLPELQTWLPALVKGTLLSPDMQQGRMFMVDWENVHGIPLQYGLGIMGASGYFGHIGENKGYHSICMYSPSSGNIIIVMVNNGSCIPLLMFAEIANLLTPGLIPFTP